MRTYIIRRLLLVIPTMILVSLMAFFLMRLMPGDIIDSMLAAGAAGADIEIDRPAIERALGLDAPLLIQYARWMGFAPNVDGNFSGISQGNLGISWWQGKAVTELLASAWPITFQLSVMSLIVAQLIALPIAIYSAIRQDTATDYIGRSFAILCISFPRFWLATLIIVFPALWWGYTPPMMFIRFTENPIGNLRMLIIPAIVMGMAMCGTTMRMTRSMMLEVLRQDYIRTAWAKGLTERVVVIRHALKNALIPVVTLMGLSVAFLIGGTVIIEEIFMLPGMGRLIINALRWRDYSLLTGLLFLIAFFLALINLMVDLTYGYLDPRIRYK